MGKTVIVSFPESRLHSRVDTFHWKTTTKLAACFLGWFVFFPSLHNLAGFHNLLRHQAYGSSPHAVNVSRAVIIKKTISIKNLAYKRLIRSGRPYMMWNFVMFLRLHSEINPQTSSLRGLVGRRVSGDHCWGICRKFVNISSIYPPLGQDNYRDLTLRHGLFGYAKLKGCDFQQLSVNAEQTQHLVGYLEHTSAITCTDLSSTIPDGAAWGAHSSFIVYILSFIVTNGTQLRGSTPNSGRTKTQIRTRQFHHAACDARAGSLVVACSCHMSQSEYKGMWAAAGGRYQELDIWPRRYS